MKYDNSGLHVYEFYGQRKFLVLYGVKSFYDGTSLSGAPTVLLAEERDLKKGEILMTELV